jgi:hypothetical protein
MDHEQALAVQIEFDILERQARDLEYRDGRDPHPARWGPVVS